ncbi:MAG TPA: hypothetical protein PKM41_05335 [Deltaproteobacteria bacterium]|nr:hypothetical protein [Deltaproteobacteria bacterium]HOI06163.1 hypothetical protein [Deltaproteobacteria bacterium]
MERTERDCPSPGKDTWVSSELTCVTCAEHGSFHAFIYDINPNSVCLVTDHELRPEDVVTVRTEGGDETGVRFEGATGVVQWSREVERGKRSLYLAGVRMPGSRKGEEEACRMCGISTDAREVVFGHGVVWLCPECHEHLKEQPELLDQITDRFLIGNPL